MSSSVVSACSVWVSCLNCLSCVAFKAPLAVEYVSPEKNHLVVLIWEGHGKFRIFLHYNDFIHHSHLIFVSGLHLHQDNTKRLSIALCGAAASLASAGQGP